MDTLRGLTIPVVLAFVLSVGSAGAPRAAEPPVQDVVPPGAGAGTNGAGAEDNAETAVEDLLDRLAQSTSKKEATALERRIVRVWNSSGSDTVDHLVQRAGAAIKAEDFGVALQYLDTVVNMMPRYAEGWNMRATVYYLIDEYELSLSDIRQTLALQPRHFGALSGLGMIFRELDEPGKALDAFRQVLAVHPFFGKARQSVERLEKEVEGREI